MKVELLDKLIAEGNLSDANQDMNSLKAAPEPKVIAFSYNLPLANVQKMQIQQFEKSTFSRDTLARKKGQPKSSSDNPRITPLMEELGRIENNDQVTVYYKGRTGLLDALYNNSLIMDGDYIDSLAQQILTANAALKSASGSGQPAKKSPGRGGR